MSMRDIVEKLYIKQLKIFFVGKCGVIQIFFVILCPNFNLK